ncbi:MAG TPA: DNA topoisomerase (ATP-hydrolyzing), partial [Anaerolineales bacterium]|nr:DNA topoisomerase (ATP-hydrolyzing) [Anaerolineales bacterium]
MDIGTLKKIDINEEMQQSYLDYAMSVIVSRALPDARDGLKPVHRRILYAMHDMSLNPDTPHKKSARIVGEVLGKYHPHSDQAVYDAMARMAQDFSTRYLLVDGQGNFGSIDGDPPAAMRYTEARLTPAALDLLGDIDKDTVEFTPNFDDTLVEPAVLPSAIPNLLVNGATGIAVGMATNIPPHNLSEVIDALNFMLGKWTRLDDVTVDDLMQFIQGPDFPTGGIILQQDAEEGALKTAYGTGRGRITVQARVHLEDASRGRTRLIVTELPYMTNKASLIERIASLARDGVIEGIADLRDESAREEMRVVIELSKGAAPDSVLGELYKRTPMQGTFGIIILALVDGEPRLLGLKQALRVFLEHRLEVVRRRSEFDLAKARHQAHILEGLRIALAGLDRVIETIRRSRTVQTARDNLRKSFKLSDDQALAILNMPLRRLAALERQKIEEDYRQLVQLIRKLEELLKSQPRMRTVVAEELERVKSAFGDRRKTQIVSLDGQDKKTAILTARDFAPDQEVWISVMEDGRISRTIDDKPPRLSGSAASSWLVLANSRDTLYLVNEQGEAAAIGVHSLPETDSPPDGTPISQITPLRSSHPLAAILSLPPRDQREEGWFALGITAGGMVKKTEVIELPGPSGQSTFTFMRVNDGDRLSSVHITNGQNEVLMATASGMAIRYSEDEIRPMGLVAAGVMGIKLKTGDIVVGTIMLPSMHDAFLIREDGFAKRVKIGQFPKQGRYGQGVIAWPLNPGERLVGLAAGKGTHKVTLHLAKLAPKQVRLDAAPLRGRPSNGASVLDLKSGDRIVRLTSPEGFP